jgi:glycosyltransferase involved in cell wall biosynthesis
LLVVALIFFAAVGIQVGFFTAFLVAFSRERVKNNYKAAVSIIVCAHDEEENLKALIPLLLSQDHPDFEVIIINDRSNDATFDLMLEETKKDSRLRTVYVERIPDHVDGKKYALTLGIKAAKNDWVLLTDADCRPQNNQWINAMAAQCNEQTAFILGYSPYLTLPGFLNKFVRFESLVTAMQYLGFALLKKPYMGVGRNMAYRKSFFLEQKGFNNLMHITGGDDDLFVNQYATRDNTAVGLGADTLVYSVPKKTWKSFFYQKVRHLSVGKRYRFKHRFILGSFTITWILSWVAGIASLFLFVPPYWIAGVLLIRIIMFFITMRVTAKNLDQKFEAWPIVFLDFLYCIYYISTGLVAFFTKKVQWRN